MDDLLGTIVVIIAMAILACLFGGGIIYFVFPFATASFSVEPITYTQSVALFVLCRMLFGNSNPNVKK